MIVVSPNEFAVTTPFSSTVAILGSPTDQETFFNSVVLDGVIVTLSSFVSFGNKSKSTGEIENLVIGTITCTKIVASTAF